MILVVIVIDQLQQLKMRHKIVIVITHDQSLVDLRDVIVVNLKK